MKTFIVLAVCLVGAFAYQSPENRIVNGQPASATDFPYQVAVQVYSPPVDTKCGGAIITERTILTAAHCFDSQSYRGKIKAGTNYWFSGYVGYFDNALVHENYFKPSQGTTENDIALIFLNKALPLNSDTIKIIPISQNFISPNEVVVASGYGRIGDTTTTDYLNYASMVVRGNNQCGIVKQTMLCAAGSNKESTCKGDSGSPLVVGWPNNPVHVGIVSYGPKICSRGYPRVFTRTSSFVNWIREHQYDYTKF